MEPFRNEPLTDFSDASNAKAFEAGLAKAAADLGKEYPLIIGGERVTTNEWITSINPADKKQVVGRCHGATKELAEKAIETAYQTFASWRHTPAQERSDYFFKGAKLLRERKHEFSATMVYETGKSWVEADADTAEAIDFLDFYARENLRYADQQPLTEIPGEKNELTYLPLGVCVVIPPWNFPLAIMAGMTVAAAVTGNTVVLKPSSDSPVIAAKFVDLMEEAGLPRGVINFLPGRGSQVGDNIVVHPKTRMIAFTGSKEVGLRISELAAKTSPGQIWIKRLIAEMGGKDSIVVDDEADLDSAADGVIVSAFGFQGQKCSACSRAIIVEKVYDDFVAKVKERAAKLTQGSPTDKNHYMGPVINEKAFNSIMEYIKIGKGEGELINGGNGNSDKGFFIEPTVIKDVDPMARISQEEIFGPVLALFKAKDYDHAMEIANNTEYGLTGAVYTKNEAKINQAKRDFFVGNLYFNRKCTGALVGGHPFGGFNMSGTDSKAGGRDYLLLFMQAKLCSQKV